MMVLSDAYEGFSQNPLSTQEGSSLKLPPGTGSSLNWMSSLRLLPSTENDECLGKLSGTWESLVQETAIWSQTTWQFWALLW